MSHPFCGSEVVCPPSFPTLGWEGWNGRAMYIRAVIDESVTHKVECGEAIRRWNEQVGARFLILSDKGDVQIKFFERNSNEWPFNFWLVDGNPAAGFALNYDRNGILLGVAPGVIARSEIYVNRELAGARHQDRVFVFAHEMGHAFGLADHPKDNINSLMSYQPLGRLLLGPSFEDVHGISHIYNLHDLLVRPEDLEGIENVIRIWHFDRYGRQQSHLRPQSRWQVFVAGIGMGPINDLNALEPFETYSVRVKTTDSPAYLGFGRFRQQVFPNMENLWIYQ